MTVFQGFVLGILQGITEFLPVSSSGHLAVAQHLFGLDSVPLLFDVFLHLATLCAVIIFFRRQIGLLLMAFGRWIARRPLSTDVYSGSELTGTDEASRRTVRAIIIATIITGAIGIVTDKMIPELPVRIICAGFIITALLLLVSSYIEKKAEKKATVRKNGGQARGISPVQAVVIGVLQGVGTLPGISRSGSTIAGGQLCGVNREAAGEFSFIVSIPAILGAFILELRNLGAVSSSIGAIPVVAGCVAAFAMGYSSLSWLMKMIRKGHLEWFACYLIPAGVLGMIFLK